MGCKHATNLAQQTSTFGSHRGETLAFKKHLDITKVRQDILDIIQATSSIPIRFSAVIVTTHDKQDILAVTYWYSNQSLSENNKELLGHLSMLKHLLGLPLLTFGDYNIPHTLLEESGWLKPHRFNIHLLKGGPSTKFGKDKIDYLLFAGDLGKDIPDSAQLKRVPFGPHYGYRVELKGHKTIKGTVIKYPPPLPYDDFYKHLPNYSQEDLDQCWQNAQTRAQQILKTQKHRTGFAILGTPLALALADLKLKGDTLKDSICVGEQYALSALQSELYILKIGNTPDHRYNKYIGRSQFPKFYRGTNSNVMGTPPQFKFPLLHKAATTYNLVSKISEEQPLSKTSRRFVRDFAYSIQEALENNIEFYKHKTLDTIVSTENWMRVGTTLTSNHRTQFLLKDETRDILLEIQQKLSKQAGFAIKNSFADFVRQDLAAHGTRMFAFISKESKAHLSITNTIHPSYTQPRCTPPGPNKALGT